MYIIFLSTVVLLVAVGSTAAAEDAKYLCPASEVARFDSITTRVISFTPQQRKFPDTKGAIPKFCTEIKKDVSDANDIVQKCFTGSAKQFSTIIMYSVKKTVNLYCSPKSKKRHEALIEMSRCVTKNDREIRKCLNAFDNQLIRGKRAEPQNTRIGYACCNYYKLMSCLENATKPTCSAKATDTIQEFVRNLFQSIVDVACGGFEEHSDKCEKLKAPPKKTKADVAEAKTFFMPLVELFNAL